MPVDETDPVVERIATVLFERLQVRSTTSPIYFTEVIRPLRMGGFTPKHLQVVLTQDDPTEVPELFLPGNPPAIAFAQRFNIRCFVMPSEKDTVTVDDYINKVTADVVKAVCVDSDWYSFGSRALDATWESRENIDGDGGPDGINIPLTITYRTSELDPYALRA
jgi:hypothetical protein